jgi:hypothetical protein
MQLILELPTEGNEGNEDSHSLSKPFGRVAGRVTKQ